MLLRSILGIVVALLSTIVTAGRGWALSAAEVEAAVREAEQAVQAARSRDALWTTAEEALRQARQALAEGNTAGAMAAANRAKEQARLGTEQTAYPDFEWVIKDKP